MIIPDICAKVLLYPKVRPDDNSMILFGPGVNTVDSVNVAIDNNIVIV